jgi:hypothetical protein
MMPNQCPVMANNQSQSKRTTLVLLLFSEPPDK